MRKGEREKKKKTELNSKNIDKTNLIWWHNKAKICRFFSNPLSRSLVPQCYSHLYPNSRFSSPVLTELPPSRKINNLQVQAQHGATVNLAFVRKMLGFCKLWSTKVMLPPLQSAHHLSFVCGILAYWSGLWQARPQRRAAQITACRLQGGYHTAKAFDNRRLDKRAQRKENWMARREDKIVWDDREESRHYHLYKLRFCL